MFAPLGREYELVLAEEFVNEDVQRMIAGGLNTEEGGNVFNNKTWEMKRLCYLYKHDKNVKIDHRADAYVFLLDKNTNASVKGYMPRTNSEGFLFIEGETPEQISETLIHELCHGLYGLEHTFEYGVDEKSPSDNIMSYSESLNRYPSKYFQWHLIENPKDYHFPFTDSAEDGESATNWWHWIPVDNWWQTDIQSKVSKNESLFETIFDKQGKFDELKLINWTIEKDYKDAPNKWLGIKDNESVAFSDFKKSHIYTWSGNVNNDTKVYNIDRKQEKNCIYTGVNFFSFADAPSLSDYKVDEMAKLDKHKRVVAVYYGDKFGLISFFDEKENLVFAMQIYPLMSEGKDIKQITESWVRSLLVRESGEEKKETVKKKEYKPINEERYIISDPKAIIRDENFYSLENTPIVPQGTEVRKMSNYEKKTIIENGENKTKFCAKIEGISCNEENELSCFLTYDNLIKINILSDDKIKTCKLKSGRMIDCLVLPYSKTETKNKPIAGDEVKIVATCGQYVRIVSDKLEEFGEECNSQGYWVKLTDTEMYSSSGDIYLEHVAFVSQMDPIMKFSQYWNDKEEYNQCCCAASNLILNWQGTSTDRRIENQVVIIEKWDTNTCTNLEGSKTKLNNAIEIIDKSLYEHNLPILVGVHHLYKNKDENGKFLGWKEKCSGSTPKRGNTPRITNHYIVIVGKQISDGNPYYWFYEVGVSYNNNCMENGTSKENKLYIDNENNILHGIPYYIKTKKYSFSKYKELDKVTEVRKNNGQDYKK